MRSKTQPASPSTSPNAPGIQAAQAAAAPKTTAGLTRMPRWMYGYGLVQGSTAAGESLIVFFGAAVLGLSPALIGVLDSANNIAMCLGAIVLAVVLNHVRHTDKLYVISLIGVGVSLALFAIIGNTGLAIALAVAFGLVLAPAGALAPVMASRHLTTSMWSKAFSYLNQASSLGGALGIALGAAWLAVGARLSSQELAIRMLFIGIGIMAIVGALQSYVSLKFSAKKRPILGSEESQGYQNPIVHGVDSYRGLQLPVVSDALIFHLVFSFILFMGLGMSFSGIHTYLVRDLRASVAVAMAAIMGFKLVNYFISPIFTGGFAQLLPVQLVSLASIGRSACLVAMPVMAMILPPTLALPAAIVLIALWGISSGALSIAGVGATAQLALPGRWQESMSLYVAVTNAGVITGAWVGGAVAGVLGFEGMFFLAAGLSLLSSILMLRN